MKSALKTTPLIMATTLTILRPPEHRTPLSASGFARTGMEEEADTIYGLGTRSLEGATSRAVWMVNSMPYNSLKMCMKTTITIMHLVPGIAPTMSTHPMPKILGRCYFQYNIY